MYGRRLSQLGCRLIPAHEIDPAQLLRFERDERDYFRRWIPDRGDAYYRLEAVEDAQHNAREWWDAGSDKLHVVIDSRGQLLARANLVNIVDGIAEVGYRVGRTATGRGIATASVTDLVLTARNISLNRLRATTSTENQASAHVVTACGFLHAGFRPAALEVNGRRLDAQDWYLDLA